MLRGQRQSDEQTEDDHELLMAQMFGGPDRETAEGNAAPVSLLCCKFHCVWGCAYKVGVILNTQFIVCDYFYFLTCKGASPPAYSFYSRMTLMSPPAPSLMMLEAGGFVLSSRREVQT